MADMVFVCSIIGFALLGLVVGVGIGHMAGWNGGFEAGRQRERISTARAMETIRKAYAVPPDAAEPADGQEQDEAEK